MSRITPQPKTSTPLTYGQVVRAFRELDGLEGVLASYRALGGRPRPFDAYKMAAAITRAEDVLEYRRPHSLERTVLRDVRRQLEVLPE